MTKTEIKQIILMFLVGIIVACVLVSGLYIGLKMAYGYQEMIGIKGETYGTFSLRR